MAKKETKKIVPDYQKYLDRIKLLNSQISKQKEDTSNLGITIDDYMESLEPYLYLLKIRQATDEEMEKSGVVASQNISLIVFGHDTDAKDILAREFIQKFALFNSLKIQFLFLSMKLFNSSKKMMGMDTLNETNVMLFKHSPVFDAVANLINENNTELKIITDSILLTIKEIDPLKKKVETTFEKPTSIN